MAGACKPNIVDLGREARYEVIALKGSQGSGGTIDDCGLFNEIILSEWNTKNVFYWYNDDEFLEIDLKENCNIWRSGTDQWPDSIGLLDIYRWQNNMYEDVTDQFTQNISNKRCNEWEKYIENVPSGKYKFVTRGIVRLDSEWFLESIKPECKYMLKKDDKVIGFKDGYISFDQDSFSDTMIKEYGERNLINITRKSDTYYLNDTSEEEKENQVEIHDDIDEIKGIYYKNQSETNYAFESKIIDNINSNDNEYVKISSNIDPYHYGELYYMFDGKLGQYTGDDKTENERVAFLRPNSKVKVEFKDKTHKMSRYVIKSRVRDEFHFPPKKWVVYSSLNGIDWEIIDTQKEIFIEGGGSKEFRLSNPREFKFLMFHFEEGYGDYIDIGELELIGCEPKLNSFIREEEKIIFVSENTIRISNNEEISEEEVFNEGITDIKNINKTFEVTETIAKVRETGYGKYFEIEIPEYADEINVIKLI